MTKKALIIASNGSEEIELVGTIDVLRTAGIDVTIAGLQDQKVVTLVHQVKMEVDVMFKDVCNSDAFDAVILPGGETGTQNLAKDPRVGEMLKRYEKCGKIVAAICHGPLAFASHGIAKNGKVTSYPAVKDRMIAAGYDYVDEGKVCVQNNGKVVTSRGPGTTFEFGLKLVEMLLGAEHAHKIKQGMII